MIFADTSGWVARVLGRDEHHAAATDWMQYVRPKLITTDYVVDESLTWLRSHGADDMAIVLGEAFFEGGFATVHVLTPAEVRKAWKMFSTYRDKE
jgi:uncharacterized protein